MATGYRTGEPNTGEVVKACRSKSDLKELGGGNRHLDAYRVSGKLVKDTGEKDGLEIKVESYRKI